MTICNEIDHRWSPTDDLDWWECRICSVRQFTPRGALLRWLRELRRLREARAT